MAFEPLRTDYKDAVWAGLRKYLMLKNEDDTVSLKDVTQYTVYDDAFFGAEDANRINAAINAIMASVEKGTDLYEAFTAFFEAQKKAFTAEADKQNEDFGKYLDGLEQTADADIAKMKDDYTAEIKNFENTQEAVYNTWFDHIKDQLSDDAAGNLQAQIDNDVFKSYRGILENIDTAPKDVKSGCYAVFSSGVIYDLLLCFNSKQGSATALQVLLSFDLKKCKIRPAINNGSWGPWRPLAFADDMASIYAKREDISTQSFAVGNGSTLSFANESYAEIYDIAQFRARGNRIVMKSEGNYVYRSVDDGRTWKKDSNLGVGQFKFLKWPGSNQVFIATNKSTGTCSRSVDGGNTWVWDYSNFWGEDLCPEFCVTQDAVVAYSELNNLKMNRSTNGDMAKWESINVEAIKSGYKIGKILYNDKDNFFYVYLHDGTDSATGYIQKTKDLTGTWKTVTDNINVYGMKDLLCTDGRFYYITAAGELMYSDDSIVWNEVTNAPKNLNSLAGKNGVLFVTRTTASGITGGCWRSEDTGITWNPVITTGTGYGNEKCYLGDELVIVKYERKFNSTKKTDYNCLYVLPVNLQDNVKDLSVALSYKAAELENSMANVEAAIKELEPSAVTIGDVTAADSATISGTAKKITLLVKKVTATATTGAAIYQYINLPTTEDGVTAPKLSALTGTLSTSHGTIAVSGSDILLKSVKGFSITAIIDYKNY